MSEGSVDKLRLTISGSANGHNTTVYVYDSDIEEISASGKPVIDGEVGFIKFIVDDLESHGVLAYTRGGDNNSGTPSRPQNQSEDWMCPEHGNKNVIQNYFNKAKKACGYNEVATGWDKPSWASKDTPSGKKGSGDKFWFCKYKEN